MKLLFALGNPGPDYDGTRHNAGFLTVDSFAQSHGASFTDKPKFKCQIAEIHVHGEKLLIAKPTTFYNVVGESYRTLIDFYKISPEDTLVVHDELALPFGTIRARIGGSDAGNNGIKSINLHGGADSRRIRIGIGNEQRAVMGDTDFVLGKFSKDEMTSLTESTKTIAGILDAFIRDTFEVTTHNG